MAQRGRLGPAARVLGILTVMLSAFAVASCQSAPRGASIDANADQRWIGAVPVDDPTPPTKITIAPADNTVNVPLDAVVKVTASGGTLTKVDMTQTGGSRVTGGLTARKVAWASTSSLAPDTVYRVAATAVNAEGESSRVVQTFSTMQPSKELTAEILPGQGSAVGVGEPIDLRFNEPVKNKAGVERRLAVETSKPVEGAWHWFGDKNVRYRPKTYWPAHTNVTVKVNLRGARSGSGSWGLKDQVRRFSITNSVITKVDLGDHHARTYIDGKLARTIPVTGGKAGWRTRNGIKVVLAKETDKVFTNEMIGAAESYRLTSKWAIRVTLSGEFLHTASWSTGSQGSANVSHGCVGMNTADSDWLYHVTHVGDPVEVKSPDAPQMEASNGYGDWNFTWDKWKAGSALK